MTHNLEHLRARVEEAAEDIRQHHEWSKRHRYEVPERVIGCVRRAWWRNWRRAMDELRAAQNIRRAA